MSRIACLGWGSLVWDPRELPIRRKWFDDGPIIAVEFVRQSKDGRLTLVLHESGTPVRSLWAMMDTSDLPTAKAVLQQREGVDNLDSIKTWEAGANSPKHIADLSSWARAHGIDAVIWTALLPKFQFKAKAKPEYKPPSPKQAVAYLRTLQGAQRDLAEQYIRKTPKQVDTAYRRLFEANLGWTFQE